MLILGRLFTNIYKHSLKANNNKTIKVLFSTPTNKFSQSTIMSHPDEVGLPLHSVLKFLEEFASKDLAESWDNTGLLLEPYTPRNISKILLTNDLTEEVTQEALQMNVGLIVSYHPPIFAPMKSITQDFWKQRIVSGLIEARIALYSPHTAWDNVRGGVNDWLTEVVPFETSEIILKKGDPNFGSGRFCQIKEEESVTLQDVVHSVKQHVGIPCVRLAIGRGKSLTSVVKSVAFCAGSGASVLKDVKSDLYITGEMLHHDVLNAAQNGISVILTNHSDSERGFLKVMQQNLIKGLGNNVSVIVSEKDTDPLKYV